MRIAIVGSGPAGLAAAHLLSEDPRHVITVFETHARLGGRADELHRLHCLGVTLRRTAQVERFAIDDAGADLWIHGLAERFDLALVATSPAEARALLERSGMSWQFGPGLLGQRIYFTEHGFPDAVESARGALARMAADHPSEGPRRPLAPRRDPSALQSLVRHVQRSHVQYLDHSGHTWPLGAPAVYIANQRWILDVAPRYLMVQGLETNATVTAAEELEAGTSVGFVVGGRSLLHGRGAALAALAANAAIVPIAAERDPRRRRRIVIGEPFYAETSAIDELMDDMCMVVRHLERLA